VPPFFIARPRDTVHTSSADPSADSASRDTTRAGGGFDASDNAQTAVDEAAHIIVAAELTNSAGDAAQWTALVMLTRISLSEGGRRVQSNMLELPLGGGSGEPCVQPPGVWAAFSRADS